MGQVLKISGLLMIVFFYSCSSSMKLKSRSKFNLDHLYKIWDVESISAGNKLSTGEEMGNPKYEFQKEGIRIKSYIEPPHSESVKFFLRNDSIHYISEKNLPSSAILELTKDKLVLKNEKAEWRLFNKNND